MAETAKALYERLAIEREVYIDRAEDCAKYTIPFYFLKKKLMVLLSTLHPIRR